jgi:exonuclease III
MATSSINVVCTDINNVINEVVNSNNSAVSHVVDKLNLISFNLHGFNQGEHVIDELLFTYKPDVLFMQEYWLTSDNLSRMNKWSDYFFVGNAAMRARVDAGPLVGRPAGGIGLLVSAKLASVCKEVFSSERILAVTLYDCLLINVYFPCAGTDLREDFYAELLHDIGFLCEKFNGFSCIIGGDWNVDLSVPNGITTLVKKFFTEQDLVNCIDIYPGARFCTYVNESLKQSSVLDHFAVADRTRCCDFAVIEPDINFSDHLPIFCQYTVYHNCADNAKHVDRSHASHINYLRWDYADLNGFYESSRVALEVVNHKVSKFYDQCVSLVHCSKPAISEFVVKTLDDIVTVLNNCARFHVPAVRKGALKYWWNEELDELKEASINSHRAWVVAGRPAQGFWFDTKQRCRRQYRAAIRAHQQADREIYSNDLHDALMAKNPNRFWKTWKAKLEVKPINPMVCGSNDPKTVVGLFEEFFSNMAKASSSKVANDLHARYSTARTEYVGNFCDVWSCFSVGTLSRVIDDFKRGRACGLDLLCAEHLQCSHPIVVVILAKLFKMILLCGEIPYSFKSSYTVPLLKSSGSYGKLLTCEDFRGITINSVVSKVFEKAILVDFADYFVSHECQFGFKRGLGCSQAIFAARTIVDFYNAGSSTANLCTLDIAKAFPSVNHSSLFTHLMARNLPGCVLEVLENWYHSCFSCVKWQSFFSDFYQVSVGVLQGSCLAPALFAVCMDEVIRRCVASKCGYIIVYADDILLVSRSVHGLQSLIRLVDLVLSEMDLNLNFKKSYCMRIGDRANLSCPSLTTESGANVEWRDCVRYLGVDIVSSRVFKVSYDNVKRSFNRAANAILSKIGGKASHLCLVELLNAKCVPILLYATETCTLPKSMVNSLDFVVKRFLFKIFCTFDKSVIEACVESFGIHMPSCCIPNRAAKFRSKFRVIDNKFCAAIECLSSARIGGCCG